MSSAWWCVVVPGLTEAALVLCCAMVWVRLRRLGVTGVCRWTLLVVGLDTLAQAHQLWMGVGRPAGVGWMLHTVVSYAVVYALYGLAGFSGRVEQVCERRRGGQLVAGEAVQERG
jgi:hypothetical protein